MDDGCLLRLHSTYSRRGSLGGRSVSVRLIYQDRGFLAGADAIAIAEQKAKDLQEQANAFRDLSTLQGRMHSYAALPPFSAWEAGGPHCQVVVFSGSDIAV
jgi:hypothetical protein